jgi:ribosomal protein S6--L-glutamate ligase
MYLNIGIITVRGPDYHPTRRLAEAAGKRGHAVVPIHPYRVWPGYDNGKPVVAGLSAGKMPHVVLPRQGADVGDSCLALVKHFDLMGIPVINDFDAIRLSRNQFYTLQSLSAVGVAFPDTVFINNVDGIGPAVGQVGGYPVVVKQVSGRQGKGVVRVASRREADELAATGLDRRSGLLVQRFLPPEGRGDLRVFMIGDKVAGAIELKPPAGDFRANYHISGESRAVDLSPEIAATALSAAKALDLEIAGVDIIVPAGGGAMVIELNYSPGFKGLEAATGLDIAGMIIDYAVERCHREGSAALR